MHELFKELKHYHVYINGVTINFPQLIIRYYMIRKDYRALVWPGPNNFRSSTINDLGTMQCAKPSILKSTLIKYLTFLVI
jgi:hypothetical protein